MHALRSTQRWFAGLALAGLLLIGLAPRRAEALPMPGFKSTPVHLYARSFGYIAVNRVFMGLSTRGEVGVDSAGSGTIGGGFWPRGTVDQYVFNSGLWVSGIIGGVKSASNPWGGDTASAKFFDPIGTQRHGQEVTKIYNGNVADDVANWPDDALVPQGDSVELLYDPLLRGQINASQGDAHFISWDGDPALISGRPHPLGVVVDYRVMGWNYPSGNQDIVYCVLTFYNITTTDESAYANVRPAIRSILIQKSKDFQALNNAKFGITLPPNGYTINPGYAAFSGDFDVGTAGRNYASVNFAFALGFAYQSDFFTSTGWTFDPKIFGAPFFPGVGFVGVKYLKGPSGPGKIQLFSLTTNGGVFPDPGTSQKTFRIMKGTPIPADGTCNIPGDPAITHVCFIKRPPGADIRFYQSSEALNLTPGGQNTIVAAYIFAAPVAIPGFTPVSSTTGVDPGDPTWMERGDSLILKGGANKVDSISGFLKYNGPATNPDGSVHEPTQDEFTVVPGSLLGKSLVAQTVFNNHFLLPFAPTAPDFFLIPGDKQVTILWKTSPSEATGDAFFAVASTPTVTTPTGPAPNALYDPNYRKFDVEGYRIYRGRSDSPSGLKLLVQFDYAGTQFKDFGGIVQAGVTPANAATGTVSSFPECAPELGVTTDCAGSTKITPGTTSTVSRTFDISGPLVQTNYGDRTLLANGKTFVLTSDTLVTGGGSEFPALKNNGVPFIFVDKAGNCPSCGVANGVRYYYAVTAFDVNSFKSGPSSLESPRIAKSVVVGAPAANFNNAATASTGVYGRKGLLTDNTMPTLDATTGMFSKAFPPGNGVTVALAAFATQVLKGAGSVAVQFDSSKVTAVSAGTSNTFTDFFSIITGSGTTQTSLSFTISATSVAAVSASANFSALAIDPALAGIYTTTATGYTIPGTFTATHLGAYYSGQEGRGCANNALGAATTRNTQCYFGNPRWFVGANESTPNPTVASPVVNLAPNNVTTAAAASYANAGVLPGVVTAHHPDAYGYFVGTGWRDVELTLSPFVTAADYKLYWGAAGKIDSVIDVTHDEPVPFKSDYMGSSWGVLNSSAVPVTGSYDLRAELTATDFACVAPLRSFAAAGIPACTATGTLSQTAVPGPIAFFTQGAAGTPVSLVNSRTAAAAPNAGFGLYLKGRVYMFELTGGAVPAAGTVWTARDYVGAIYGGKGTNPGTADEGAYLYVAAAVRPLTAPGAQVKFAYNVSNEVTAVTATTLEKIHTVPDPYYVTSALDRAVTNKVIQFVNVPTTATIRIYTVSGVLVRVLTNNTTTNFGTVNWDVRNRSNQYVASGVYFYNVESGGVSRTGRMTIVNYASNIQ